MLGVYAFLLLSWDEGPVRGGVRKPCPVDLSWSKDMLFLADEGACFLNVMPGLGLNEGAQSCWPLLQGT